jgi:tRNA(Arg) A34 adenosine deaminase TadA
MNKTDLIAYACNLASYSVANGGGPFGCVIVDNTNTIIQKS